LGGRRGKREERKDSSGTITLPARQGGQGKEGSAGRKGAERRKNQRKKPEKVSFKIVGYFSKGLRGEKEGSNDPGQEKEKGRKDNGRGLNQYGANTLCMTARK